MDESLLFISLTNALRVVSRRVIGLVRFKSHSRSAGFGIGYTVACFQAVGISLWIQHKLTNCQSAELICEPIWRSISLEIPEGPAALPKGNVRRMSDHSS